MIRVHNGQETATFFSRRQLLLVGGSVAASMIFKQRSAAAQSAGISRTAEAIHQEVSFTSNRKRVYEALTETNRFDRVVQLSGVMQSAGLAKMKAPTEISDQAGGAFSAFGGYITGRQIELVPSQLIVQAWRAGSWEKGVYSIARFALVEQGGGTNLQFDHTGFPVGQAEHLAAGWKEHYWEPLQKYLSEG
jgi:activator of HSP90 ATPase